MDDKVFAAFACGLLALARISMVFVQAPIWGSQHFKAPVKAGMAVAVTLLVFPHLTVPPDLNNWVGEKGLLGFIPLILMQLAVGLVIGWVSFLVMATAQFGGEMLDIQMGLSVAAQSDPSSHGAVNLLRRLHFYMAMLLYLMLDGHHELWKAIFWSFKVVPLTHFQMTKIQMDTMIALAGEIYKIGLQIASPAVGALFIAQVALGLMARVAPQMNVFMLSFPLNLSVGMILLVAALPYILRCFGDRFIINNQFDASMRSPSQIQRSIVMIRPASPTPTATPIPRATP